ncbi:MAG: hypothetical protein GF317_04145 [Candidatus Lokiarchaeota archaeon]|nr:hypothetical protein [Candidatus Lokiarchaeota archaeon]MBD3199078.1 hypothetical protein [Candidatus Lokiarchaeota archaeon]
MNKFEKKLIPNNLEYVPLYCTGFPYKEFLNTYVNFYSIESDNNDKLILYGKDFSLIKNMGFEAFSLWDFRRKKTTTHASIQNIREYVDEWGRIYKGDWYSWNGAFSDITILNSWDRLKLPTQKAMKKLHTFLNSIPKNNSAIVSIPGLFEKTWQSIGFIKFSKAIRNRDDTLIDEVATFFLDYLKRLTQLLHTNGAFLFLVADDLGYKNRLFLPKRVWNKYFKQKYKEIVELIHGIDGRVILHSDGYISEMIPTFIDIGFDAVQSLESNAGVDIFSLFRKIGNKICFIGNLDVSTLLTYGTPREVRNYVSNLLKSASKYDVRLVVSPTQQLHQQVQIQNVKEMISTVKKWNTDNGF